MSWYFSPHFHGISVAYHCLLLSITTEPFPDLHCCKELHSEISEIPSMY